MMDILFSVKGECEGGQAMRVSQAEKDRSHARIVDSAARLLRERGVENTSVTDVMSDAGLTHGGFYRHFDSKDALTVAAVQAAFDQFLRPLEDRIAAGDSDAALAQFRTLYLSQGHVEHAGMGCPVPSLASEIGRAGPALKDAFAAGVRRSIAALAAGAGDTSPDGMAAAAREFAMLAGAVMLARAAGRQTAHDILAACKT